MKRVLLIGDSIRIGYAPRVREGLGSRVTLLQPEANCGSSAQLRANLVEWVLRARPEVVHLNCGLHDIRRDFGAQANAVPPHEYEDNLRAIVQGITSATDAALVWASTTPVNEAWHHAHKDFDRFEADVVAYNAIAATVAEEAGVLINDLYRVIKEVGRDTVLRDDGVHFTPDGYRLLGDAVVACLSEMLEQ